MCWALGKMLRPSSWKAEPGYFHDLLEFCSYRSALYIELEYFSMQTPHFLFWNDSSRFLSIFEVFAKTKYYAKYLEKEKKNVEDRDRHIQIVFKALVSWDFFFLSWNDRWRARLLTYPKRLPCSLTEKYISSNKQAGLRLGKKIELEKECRWDSGTRVCLILSLCLGGKECIGDSTENYCWIRVSWERTGRSWTAETILGLDIGRESRKTWSGILAANNRMGSG